MLYASSSPSETQNYVGATANSRTSPDDSITKDPFPPSSGPAPSGAGSRQRGSRYSEEEDFVGGDQRKSGAASKRTPVIPMSSSSYLPRGAVINAGTRFGQGPAQPVQSFKLDDDFGTSSTETLVQPMIATLTKPTGRVSFVDNGTDYSSSQDTYTASMAAVGVMTEDVPGITVYY